ncbi:glycolipid 2-alpha-mannosyltransferase [Sodiomyces alkalinus F11]|uniref:Glycolipid 2-alpha-mannosyltransferase n=1 Tax=Sodiomyces alkalinus (strain CBS 110278 / VKM F-3762 / F11) TaxID=1314773 RepID=A0A3N2PRB2_SODAK|nr:glycolipid 2-alpha-mannosyltransferase [Sodiomyces alkalinus F11]ROT36886.1 glycolipid 2-alpha-mannosyltransferase [Sodiomyces alkalinus F11]
MASLLRRTKRALGLPREPDVDAPREDAVVVMMARNSERQAAQRAIESFERHFNRWFQYPIVFLNHEPWDKRFIRALSRATSAETHFEVMSESDFGYPDGVDRDAARASMVRQKQLDWPHAGKEGYHHMCRFYSGKFYNMDILKKYKWYWRLDPDTEFFCSITYDPFVEMAKRGHVYGFTMAIWEVLSTVPSLFRHTADYKDAAGIPSSPLWKAMVDPSPLPYPLRSLTSLLGNRDRHGDAWNGCHYWSNFEIGDMDFFRGSQYQAYFDAMDRRGGFYFERWGDAAIHSLAVAMLLHPSQVHHFDDIGYRHDELWQCPANALGGQLPESEALGKRPWQPEVEGGIGCRCECKGYKERRNHPAVCLNKLTAPNTPGSQPWLPWT